MDDKNYFKDLLKSIPDYRKIVFLVFLNLNDENLLQEIGFSKKDYKKLNLGFTNILINDLKNSWIMLRTKKKVFLKSFYTNKW